MSTWQPSSIHFRHGTSLLRIHGHFGLVYLLQVSKNDDVENCFLKQFGFSFCLQAIGNTIREVIGQTSQTIVRYLSGNHKKVIKESIGKLSGINQEVVKKSSGRQLAVMKELSGRCQEIIRHFSNSYLATSCQGVIRQTSSSHRAVVMQSSKDL